MIVLTPDEIEELTGRKRPAAQCRALESMGLVYLTGADGRPRVLRALVEARLGGARLGGATLPAREPQLRP